MKKAITTILILILLSGITQAVKEGQQFTQEQFNLINFDTEPLGCQYESYYLFKYHEKPHKIYYYFSCLFANSYYINNESYYVFNRQKIITYYDIKLYQKCTILSTSQQCVLTDMKNDILNQFYTIKNSKINNMKSLQYSDIQNINFEIDFGNLN